MEVGIRFFGGAGRAASVCPDQDVAGVEVVVEDPGAMDRRDEPGRAPQ